MVSTCCHIRSLQQRALFKHTDSHTKELRIAPHFYHSQNRIWQKVIGSDQGMPLESKTPLRIVSWNIDFSSQASAARTAVALRYIQSLFDKQSARLIVLLQEVCQDSLQQIKDSDWIQTNFLITGLPPPTMMRNGIPQTVHYFNLILTPKTLVCQHSYRIPLPSEMGRHALFVDIPLYSSKDKAYASSSGPTDIFRLCTTHLESLGEGMSLRRRQLEMISQQLNAKVQESYNIIAGLVGGDMNSINDEEEHTWCSEMGLKDVWKEVDERMTVMDTQLDCSSGRVDGHTWGYQPRSQYEPKRFDKFIHTGSIRFLDQVDNKQKIQRLGIGLKADIGSEDRAWVSDHFGITVEISV